MTLFFLQPALASLLLTLHLSVSKANVRSSFWTSCLEPIGKYLPFSLSSESSPRSCCP